VRNSGPFHWKKRGSRRRGQSPSVSRAAEFVVEILERRMLLTTNSWTNANGGDWDTASNWSLGHVPLASEDAVINLSGNYTVTHAANTADSVNSLTSTVPFTLSGGALNVATTVQVSNTFTISGGTLSNATVLASGSGQGLTLSGSGSTLSGVTISTGVTIAETTSSLTVAIAGSLTLDGTLDVGNGSVADTFDFLGSQTLGGSGTVVFGASQLNNLTAKAISTPATLTFGSGITVDGGSGKVQGNSATDSIINNGTILSNVSGAGVTLSGASVSNGGTISATGGGNLSIANLQNAAGQTVSIAGGGDRRAIADPRQGAARPRG